MIPIKRHDTQKILGLATDDVIEIITNLPWSLSTSPRLASTLPKISGLTVPLGEVRPA